MPESYAYTKKESENYRDVYIQNNFEYVQFLNSKHLSWLTI